MTPSKGQNPESKIPNKGFSNKNDPKIVFSKFRLGQEPRGHWRTPPPVLPTLDLAPTQHQREMFTVTFQNWLSFKRILCRFALKRAPKGNVNKYHSIGPRRSGEGPFKGKSKVLIPFFGDQK